MERDTGLVAADGAEGADGFDGLVEEFSEAVLQPASTATIMAETKRQDSDFRITRSPYEPGTRRYCQKSVRAGTAISGGST
jgi:hypothetical protein